MAIDLYKRILEKCEIALDELSGDEERLAAFTIAHNAHDDLEALQELIGHRPEGDMYKLALDEYHQSVYSASIGLYRQAHVNLRLFIELSLSSVLFSAHEINTHLWLQGEKDTNWTSVISTDSGVFSKLFVGAFFPEMKEYCQQYRAVAETLYRECSEFVHGNWQSIDASGTAFSMKPNTFDDWVDRAETARLVVVFSFLCRYLKLATSDAKTKIEPIALEEFGQLPPIQAVFSG